MINAEPLIFSVGKINFKIQSIAKLQIKNVGETNYPVYLVTYRTKNAGRKKFRIFLAT